MGHLEPVLVAVVEERDRQEAKWGEQNHPDGTGPRAVVCHQVRADSAAWWARMRADFHAQDGRLTYLEILLEEVFEVAECEPGSAQLETELVQVAAVACAWVEKMRRDRVRAARAKGTPAELAARKGGPRG